MNNNYFLCYTYYGDTMVKESLYKLRKETKNYQYTLIVISKTQKLIREAYNEGIRNFGENHVNELIKKAKSLPKDIKWHMIGHIKINQVKQLLNQNIFLIQSIDSFNLAKKIDKESKKLNKITNILIEVNISNKESKYGIKEEDLINTIIDISSLSNIKILGLMAIGISDIDNKEGFTKLRNLFLEINKININNVTMQFLSMGTSNDYLTALDCESNMIRLEAKIFESQNNTK